MREAVDKNAVEKIYGIFREAYLRADVLKVMKKNVKLEKDVLQIHEESFPLQNYNRIIIAGVGIAALPMARYMEEMLEGRISQGIILVPPGFGGKLDKVMVKEITSPLMDEPSRRALADLLFIINGAKEDDLVILLMSKGTSEMLEMLHEGITFKDYNTAIKIMSSSGLREDDVNAIKIHLSCIKGGQLLNYTHPATAVSVMLSDQPGGDIYRTFLSPTSYDPTTYQFCRQVLIKHKLALKMPQSILNHFNLGLQGKIPETIKKDDIQMSKAYNFIVHSSSYFAADAWEMAGKLNFSAMTLSTHIQGDPLQLGRFLGSIIHDMSEFGIPLEPPCVMVASGRIDGQESERLEKCCQVAVSVASEIEGITNAYFLSGTSFLFEQKGPVACVVDGSTNRNLRKAGIDPLETIRAKEAADVLLRMSLVIDEEQNVNDCGDIFIMMII